MLATFLFGCKEQAGKITVFDNLPESTFLTEVKTALENKKPVIVAFLAEWCPHCKKYKPVFLDIKNQYQDQVAFINIDVDDQNGETLLSRFQVQGIPTTAFVRIDGSILKVNVGGLEKENLITIVEELIKSKKKRRNEPIAPFPIELEQVKVPKKEEPPPPTPVATPIEELTKPEEESLPTVNPQEEMKVPTLDNEEVPESEEPADN